MPLLLVLLQAKYLQWESICAFSRPKDTMWESGTFHIIIKFTEDYPTSPPHVRFLSRMFHPNIYSDGKICLDVLQNQWSAMYDVAAVLTSIQSLLSDPNPDSPANPQAAKVLVNDRIEYDRLVLVSFILERLFRVLIAFMA